MSSQEGNGRQIGEQPKRLTETHELLDTVVKLMMASCGWTDGRTQQEQPINPSRALSDKRNRPGGPGR